MNKLCLSILILFVSACSVPQKPEGYSLVPNSATGKLTASHHFPPRLNKVSTGLLKELPRFKEQKKGPMKIRKSEKHIFGYLEVPENRSTPSSSSIKLPVYIFKSRNPHPQKDPIIWLTGGPGQSVMKSAKYTSYYSYLEDRDLILLEQRGTEYAKPHLACPEWAKAVAKVNDLQLQKPDLLESEVAPIYAEAAMKCKTRLEKKGIDLNAYHTREIAADVEDLRKVLALDQYNVYSLSYGTKIAQVLMRDYPEHIRSVVLDSPLPLEVSYGEESLSNLMHSLDAVLLNCERDSLCRTAYPKLRSRFLHFLKEKNRDPIQLTALHPQQKKEVEFYIKGSDIALLFGGLNTWDMPKVPSMMANLLDGDYSALENWLENIEVGSGVGVGMRLSVWCAEETPFLNLDSVQAESQRFEEVKGVYPAVYRPEICNIWGVRPLDSKANQAIKSDIPTLIISGEYDSETPVGWGKIMHKNLSNSYHVIFQGLHHTPTTYWDQPCGMGITRAFFNQPTQYPNEPCLEAANNFSFDLD
ncbi:MAG: alpha/beta fold hydrolase [Bacteroidota bacterium]